MKWLTDETYCTHAMLIVLQSARSARKKNDSILHHVVSVVVTHSGSDNSTMNVSSKERQNLLKTIMWYNIFIWQNKQ